MELENIHGIKTETLLKTTQSWNGTSYGPYDQGEPEIMVTRITLEPGAKLPWHIHPHPNAVYIVSGQITIEDREGRKETFSAGEVVPETVNQAHMGMAGDSEFLAIAFYAGIQGTPISVPIK
jgi:quercetin dioxygenase-like cupin family protein